MREPLELRLPWPPSVNSYWRAVSARGSNRVIVFTTEEAKNYRTAVGKLCYGIGGFAADAHVEMDITLHPPDRRKRDADNFNKCVWDAIAAAGILHDDCQVQRYQVTKGEVVAGGLVVVKLWERRFDLC